MTEPGPDFTAIRARAENVCPADDDHDFVLSASESELLLHASTDILALLTVIDELIADLKSATASYRAEQDRISAAVEALRPMAQEVNILPVLRALGVIPGA